MRSALQRFAKDFIRDRLGFCSSRLSLICFDLTGFRQKSQRINFKVFAAKLERFKYALPTGTVIAYRLK